MDENGIIKVGQYIGIGDVIVGKLQKINDKNNKLNGVLYEIDKTKKSKGYLLKLDDKSKVDKLMTILDKSSYQVFHYH